VAESCAARDRATTKNTDDTTQALRSIGGFLFMLSTENRELPTGN